MREGEVLGLRWSDVDLVRRTVTVRRSLARTRQGWALAEPKTPRSRRTIPLASEAVAALRRQRTAQKAARVAAGSAWSNDLDLVFTDAAGRPHKGSNVTKDFAAALRRLALPHVRFHDLRHGAATLMLAAGLDLFTVSRHLGHSTIAITADTYGHLTSDRRRDAADAIEQAIG
jgi:integrase